MKNRVSISDFLKESIISEPLEPSYKGQRTDEFLGLMLAGSLLAFACGAMFKKGGTDIPALAALGSLFGHNDDKKDDKKDDSIFKSTKDDKGSDDKDDKGSDDQQKQATENFGALLAMAKEQNKNETDKQAKEKNDQMVSLLTACSFDKDGNEIPLEERLDKMKDALPEGTDFEQFKKEQTENYEKIKDDKGFREQLDKAKESLKGKNYDDFIKESKEAAKKTWGEIEKNKKENADIAAEIAKLEAETAGGTPTDEQRKKLNELKERQEKIRQENPLAAATGQNTPKPEGETKTDPKPKPEPQSEEYVVMHDDKETTIIKRPSEREEGKFVYCYKNDRDKTIPPEEAEEMIRKAKEGKGETNKKKNKKKKKKKKKNKRQHESLSRYIMDKLILS